MRARARLFTVHVKRESLVFLGVPWSERQMNVSVLGKWRSAVMFPRETQASVHIAACKRVS